MASEDAHTHTLKNGSVLAQNAATLTFITEINSSTKLAQAASTAALHQYLDRLV